MKYPGLRIGPLLIQIVWEMTEDLSLAGISLRFAWNRPFGRWIFPSLREYKKHRAYYSDKREQEHK
jgi:hypothetical protein